MLQSARNARLILKLLWWRCKAAQVSLADSIILLAGALPFGGEMSLCSTPSAGKAFVSLRGLQGSAIGFSNARQGGGLFPVRRSQRKELLMGVSDGRG
jgi:hypothetical protein